MKCKLFRLDALHVFDGRRFCQYKGPATNSNTTPSFKDLITGAGLAAKADALSLMQTVQKSDLRASGDVRLMLWRASLGKHLTLGLDAYLPLAQKLPPVICALKTRIYPPLKNS